MIDQPYAQLVSYKRWADRGLYDIVGLNLERLDAADATIMLRILDHIHVVDRIFSHHLQGTRHGFLSPQSELVPEFEALAASMREVDDWYVTYANGLAARDFERSVDFAFTNGKPARMRRGEIILHVCMHGAYHRGNAGILLQKNGVLPNQDRMTDFLEAVAA